MLVIDCFIIGGYKNSLNFKLVNEKRTEEQKGTFYIVYNTINNYEKP